MIPHASSVPDTKCCALVELPRSRLWREKAKVVAVDDTMPPLIPVISAPRPGPSQRVAI
jgi:hypothetical protein